MAQFDLVGDFQRARQNRNILSQQTQGLQREATEAPIRNELSQIDLRGARRDEQKGIAGDAQAQKTQQITTLNNVAKALAPLQGQDRIKAAQLINQRLPQEMRLDDNDLTDNGLVQMEAASRAFLTKQPGQQSAGQKERADLIKAVQPALDSKGRFDPKLADAKRANSGL
ncbi:unnamed protein product, partial [marine sediment metagenome]